MKTRLFYGSSYDRGLDILLKLWPKILKEVPETTLQVCYGWDIFLRGYADNPERMIWKERIDKEMTQKGIAHHGRVGKDKLREIRGNCDIWAYPTYFTEINCITALECQSDGLVPVTMNLAALKETVGAGAKIDGDIYDEDVQAKWLEALFKYMKDDSLWQAESTKAKAFVKSYGWDEVEALWSQYLEI